MTPSTHFKSDLVHVYTACLDCVYHIIELHHKTCYLILDQQLMSISSRAATIGTLPSSPFVDGGSHHGRLESQTRNLRFQWLSFVHNACSTTDDISLSQLQRVTGSTLELSPCLSCFHACSEE